MCKLANKLTNTWLASDAVHQPAMSWTVYRSHISPSLPLSLSVSISLIVNVIEMCQCDSRHCELGLSLREGNKTIHAALKPHRQSGTISPDVSTRKSYYCLVKAWNENDYLKQVSLTMFTAYPVEMMLKALGLLQDFPREGNRVSATRSSMTAHCLFFRNKYQYLISHKT